MKYFKGMKRTWYNRTYQVFDAKFNELSSELATRWCDVPNNYWASYPVWGQNMNRICANLFTLKNKIRSWKDLLKPSIYYHNKWLFSFRKYSLHSLVSKENKTVLASSCHWNYLRCLDGRWILRLCRTSLLIKIDFRTAGDKNGFSCKAQ